MGMFDYVNYECICPECGSDVIGFQSKDGECYLNHLNPLSVDNFYTSCDGCDSWIEFMAMDKITLPENRVFKRVVTGANDKELHCDNITVLNPDLGK